MNKLHLSTLVEAVAPKYQIAYVYRLSITKAIQWTGMLCISVTSLVNNLCIKAMQ